ncbi:hypothetical protein FHD46_07040 [Escherichia coli]|nr:hypothetical protein C1192_15760 [Escherichia marmotae]EEV6994235.1 hypothetical protein [Escherichia coli]PSS40239.1 hypothetical protein BEM40_012810 [Escherichia sp. MOD1-EC5451]PSY65576.1 hypothetical protein C7B16_11640 [Escherichia sp. 20412-1]EFA4953260.1 hypothetical protein [Escherichia coli]
MQTNPGKTGDNTLHNSFSGQAGEKCGGCQIKKICTRRQVNHSKRKKCGERVYMKHKFTKIQV